MIKRVNSQGSDQKPQKLEIYASCKKLPEKSQLTS